MLQNYSCKSLKLSEEVEVKDIFSGSKRKKATQPQKSSSFFNSGLKSVNKYQISCAFGQYYVKSTNLNSSNPNLSNE